MDDIVKVQVVGENDVSTDIIQLAMVSRGEQLTINRLTKPSGVVSVDARPPGVSFESTMTHDLEF